MKEERGGYEKGPESETGGPEGPAPFGERISDETCLGGGCNG